MGLLESSHGSWPAGAGSSSGVGPIDEVKQTVARRTLVLGLQHFSRAELEAVHAAGQVLQVQVLGLARIADDVTPELARATIQSVHVLGVFHASPAVRRALADRLH